MKRIFTLFAIAISTVSLAQTIEKSVPVSVYLPDFEESVPASSRAALDAKLNTLTSQCGMGAVDFTQFYLSCSASVVGKDVIPGAPTKYVDEVELNLFVTDALGKRIFDSYSLTLKGAGNSEQKAYNAAFKTFKPKNPELVKFMKGVNGKIVNYYESKAETIVAEAFMLSKARKYDEAFFRLSLVPDVCVCYTQKILPAATQIWQEYVDFSAHESLMKAKTVWAAGLNADAAVEAVQYIADIPADSKYHDEALSLLDEIKMVVSADIDYAREIERRNADRGFELAKASIDSWKAVGVAYGNNQQPITYRESYIR